MQKSMAKTCGGISENGRVNATDLNKLDIEWNGNAAQGSFDVQIGRVPLDLFTWRPEDHAKERPNIKVYKHRPQKAKTHFCVIVTSARSSRQFFFWCFFSMPLVCRVHPAKAPRPLPQNRPSPSLPPTIAHYNGALQWHHVHCHKVRHHPHP